MQDYRESQKDFWDLYAITQTAERKGRAEGKDEERIKNARGFKAKGVDINIISEVTGLSAEEIEKL